MNVWLADIERSIETRGRDLRWLGEPLELHPLDVLASHVYRCFYAPGRPISLDDAGQIAIGLSSEFAEYCSQSFGPFPMFSVAPDPSGVMAGIHWRLEAAAQNSSVGGARLSPGFVAYSNQGFLAANEIPRLRLYLNLWPAGIGALLRLLGAHAYPALHSVKVLRPPRPSYRADPAVVYFRGVADSQIEKLISHAVEATDGLRLGVTPSMTYEIAAGAALAVGPADGGSFGMHRSTLIAHGLLDFAHADARRSVRSYIDGRFAAASISVDTPHLDGRAFRDVFHPNTPPAAAHRRLPATSGVVLGDMSYGTITSGSERLWLSPAMEGVGGVDPYLYSGHAGIALALCAAGVAGHEGARNLALQAARAALRQQLDPGREGLHLGAAGVIGALALIVRDTGDAQLEFGLMTLAREFSASFSPSDKWNDLFAGSAGTVIGLSPALHVDGIRAAFELAASRVARRIDDLSIRGWPQSSPGLAHGLAGSVAAAAVINAHSQQTRVEPTALARVIATEDSFYDPGERNWPRHDPSIPIARWTMTQRSWCHGSPGIYLSRRAAELPLPDTFRRVTSPSGLRAPIARNNWSLCHGRSGLAGVEVLTSNRPDLERCHAYLYQSMVISQPLKGWWTSPGLMIGRAGVLLAAIAMEGNQTAREYLAWALGVPQIPPVKT